MLLATVITCLTVSGLINSIIDTAVTDNAVLRFYFFIVLFVASLTMLLVKLNIATAFLHINFDLLPYWILGLLPMIYLGFAACQAIFIRKRKTKAYFILNVNNAILGGSLVFLGLYSENILVLFCLVLIRPGIVFIFYVLVKRRALFRYLSESIAVPVPREHFRPVYGYYFYGIVSILSASIATLLIRDKLAITFGLDEIGYIFSAQRIFELVMGLSVSFYSTFYFNRLCRCSVLEAKHMVLVASSLSFVFFLGVALVLNIFDKEIIILLLSSNQLPSIGYFFPLSINLLLNSFVYCTGFYILSFYDKRRLIGFEFIFLLFTVCLILFFSGRNVVWAIPIVTFFKVLLNVFILYRKFSMRGVHAA